LLDCLAVYPNEKSRCIDLGASPGGWSTVLLQYGCNVEAVDRSKLFDKIANHQKLSFIKGDAFQFHKQISDNPRFNSILSVLIRLLLSQSLYFK